MRGRSAGSASGRSVWTRCRSAPSSRSSVRRVGIIRPAVNRECAAVITSTGSSAACRPPPGSGPAGTTSHTAQHHPAPRTAGPPGPADGNAPAEPGRYPGARRSILPSRPARRSPSPPSPGTQPAVPEPALRAARTTSEPAYARISAAHPTPPPARPSTCRCPAAGPPAAAEHLQRPASGSAPNLPLRSPVQSVWVASSSSVVMASPSSGADKVFFGIITRQAIRRGSLDSA